MRALCEDILQLVGTATHHTAGIPYSEMNTNVHSFHLKLGSVDYDIVCIFVHIFCT